VGFAFCFCVFSSLAVLKFPSFQIHILRLCRFAFLQHSPSFIIIIDYSHSAVLAQLAFPLPYFGPRPIIHSAVVNNNNMTTVKQNFPAIALLFIQP
jgi:hypothetical protein